MRFILLGYFTFRQENAVFAVSAKPGHIPPVVRSILRSTTNYNLSVSSYVEREDTREAVDITALNAEIERIVAREDVLRREINAIIAEIDGVKE